MKNKVNGIYLESDLVCPNPSDFDVVCKVGMDWLLEKLYQEYGTTRISNKYVIEYKGRLYYKYDSNCYLIERTTVAKVMKPIISFINVFNSDSCLIKIDDNVNYKVVTSCFGRFLTYMICSYKQIAPETTIFLFKVFDAVTYSDSVYIFQYRIAVTNILLNWVYFIYQDDDACTFEFTICSESINGISINEGGIYVIEVHGLL